MTRFAAQCCHVINHLDHLEDSEIFAIVNGMADMQPATRAKFVRWMRGHHVSLTADEFHEIDACVGGLHERFDALLTIGS